MRTARPVSFAISLCLLSFLLSCWIIQTHQVMYWHDSYIRLAYRDQLFVARWLPALQAVIVVVSKLTDDLTVLRLVLAAIAAGAVFAMYLLAARLFSPIAGLIAVALLASNTMFIALATVPYREVLFIGLALLAFYYLDEPDTKRQLILGAVCINLACLTRAEGWLLAGIFIGASIIEPLRAKDWHRVIKITALFSFALFVWLIFGTTTLQPAETEILSRLRVDYWLAFAEQYFDLLQWQAGWGIMLLGMMGFVGAGWMLRRSITYWRIVAFLVLDLLLIGFLQPYSPGNLRQTFVVIVFLILYGSFALEKFVFRWLGKGTLGYLGRVIIVVLITFFSLQDALTFVADTVREPNFYRPAMVGHWLRTQPLEDAKVLVLADHIIQPYVIAVHSGLALESVIDLGQTEPQTVRQKLESTQVVYVTAVYEDSDGLSPTAVSLLNDLEAKRPFSQVVSVDSAQVWILDAIRWP